MRLIEWRADNIWKQINAATGKSITVVCYDWTEKADQSVANDGLFRKFQWRALA